MNIKDIQDLLISISQVLVATKDFPVFEEVTEDDSYYTSGGDLTVGDAIQALSAVAQGIENVNHPHQFSDLYLSSNLEAALISLGEVAASIIRYDRASRPSRDKSAAKEAARQDGHDISRWG